MTTLDYTTDSRMIGYQSYAMDKSQQMQNLTNELNRYFTNQVQLRREEKKAAYEEAMPIIEQLAKYVNKADPRFGGEVIKIGSSFQGLKVGEPNEYDVNIPLQGVKNYVWGPYQTRYYDIAKATNPTEFGPERPPNYDLLQRISGSLKKVDEVTIFQTSQAQPHPGGVLTFVPTNSNEAMWLNSDDVIFEGDMVPILMRKHFKKLLNEGVRELDLRKKVTVDRRFHGPAITIQIDSRDIKISIDFSVVINRATSFPDYAGWPHPNTTWPSGQKKDIITNLGVSLVARKDLHWMVSPALAERELMKGIDQDGGCRKKSHRIMKKLNEDLWSKRGKAISSYTLKNLVFWECESFPHGSQWTADMLAERILNMTRKLYECITKGELKGYFIPKRNLLEKKDEAERRELQLAKERIEKFLSDPVPLMQRLNAAE